MQRLTDKDREDLEFSTILAENLIIDSDNPVAIKSQYYQYQSLFMNVGNFSVISPVILL